MRNHFMLGTAMLAAGLGLNILDAYFSGNLPFSPENSDGNNKVSVLNRIGKPQGSGILIGTIFALSGAGILVFSWVMGASKR